MIELMIVIAIIGILVGTSVTTFDATQKRQEMLRATIDFDAVIKAARNAALIGLKDADFPADASAKAFGVHISLPPEDSEDPQTITYFNDLNGNYWYDTTGEDGDPISVTELDEDVTITRMFYDNGGVETDIDAVVVLFLPPRGTGVIVLGDLPIEDQPAPDNAIIDTLNILFGVEGDTNIDSVFTGLFELNTGGGQIDLKLY